MSRALLADLAWLPNVYVGTSYWRHDGGIQNEDGTLTRSSFNSLYAKTEIHVELDAKEAAYQKVNASRQIWQRKGELSKITSETLLDAAWKRGDKIVVNDIPLLFEALDPAQFDVVVFVDAPHTVRRTRLRALRGLKDEEADQLLAAQAPADRKRKRSDFVIDNEGSFDDLERRAREVYDELERRAAKQQA